MITPEVIDSIIILATGFAMFVFGFVVGGSVERIKSGSEKRKRAIIERRRTHTLRAVD